MTDWGERERTLERASGAESSSISSSVDVFC